MHCRGAKKGGAHQQNMISYELPQTKEIVMRAQAIIHKLFSNDIHRRRLHVVGQAVETVLHTKKLVLTDMGRHLVDDKTQERSRIRKVDRLLGNEHLLNDKLTMYGITTKWLVGNNKQPLIIIDWSKYPNEPYHILRASIVKSGRAVTLYEELHMKKYENNADVHELFLKNLSNMIPVDCHPVILLDAGFSIAILKVIVCLKYDYVVRIRGVKTFKRKNIDKYESIKGLMDSATAKIQTIGDVVLTKDNPWNCQLYMVKLPPKGREALTRGRQQGVKRKRADNQSISYAQGWKEPWVLATSLSGTDAGYKVVNMYMQRMTIEEAFRDLKSAQYGFGLSTSRTMKKNRCEVLLLLSMLATFIAWCLGSIAEKKGWHKQFQANSIYKRRVLSLISIGCAVIRKRLVILWRTITSYLKQASMPCNQPTYGVDYV